MLPLMRSGRHVRARKIWIDDALCRTARSGLSALVKRGIAAGDVTPPYAVDL
jgi:hypothetical protein